ncbi:outer membrane protein assembly factor BamB family protein [Sphaerisporangium sp. NPDC004334]
MRRDKCRAGPAAGFVLAGCALLAAPGSSGASGAAGVPSRAAPPASGVTVTVDGEVAQGSDRRGRTLWRSATAGRALGSAQGALSYGRFLVQDAEDGESEYFDEAPGRPRRVTALDAVTGSVRWTITSGRLEDGAGRPYFYLLGLADGRAVLDIPALGAVHALDLADGRLGWAARLPGGCRSLGTVEHPIDGEPRGLVDERRVTILARCKGGHVRVLRFDARDGTLRGETEVRPAGEPTLTVTDGVAVVTTPHSIAIVTPGGRVVYDRSRAGCLCDAVVLRGHGFVTADDQAGATDLEVIRLDTGAVVARRTYSQPEVTADGRRGLVAVAGAVPHPLMIWAPLRVVDVWDATTGLPLTTVSPPLTLADTARAVAIGGGWGARGGVPASAWPDPCALLTPGVLTERTGAAYRPAVAGPAPAELGLATPVSCALTPLQAGRAQVVVSVSWVYGSEREARQAVASLGSTGRIAAPVRLAPVRGADEAVYFDDAKDSIMMRTRSTLLLVEAYGESSTARHAAETAADALRGHR